MIGILCTVVVILTARGKEAVLLNLCYSHSPGVLSRSNTPLPCSGRMYAGGSPAIVSV